MKTNRSLILRRADRPVSKDDCGLKRIRRGVIWITSRAAVRPYVNGTGNVAGPTKQERNPTMTRQTRLNLAALLVALPMVLIAITTTIPNIP